MVVTCKWAITFMNVLSRIRTLQPKHILGILVAVMAITFVYLFFYDLETQPWKGYAVETRQLEGRTVRLLVADTNEKRTQGLMYVRKLHGYDGMIFKFPSPSELTFWNKNTFVPLDVYWLNGESVVGKTYLPPITETKEVFLISSPQKADTVIELVK